MAIYKDFELKKSWSLERNSISFIMRSGEKLYPMENLLIATSTSLHLGDHKITFSEPVEFKLGLYKGGKGPNQFYWDAVDRLAEQKGFSSQRKYTQGDYLYFPDGDRGYETTKKILIKEVEQTLPDYVKFLRIIHYLPDINWTDRVLKPLEVQINALRLEGLVAFLFKKSFHYSRGGPTKSTPVGVEIAMLEKYQIRVEY